MVEMPDDLTAALAKDSEAEARFAVLAYSHHTEYIRWIGEAKRGGDPRRLNRQDR